MTAKSWNSILSILVVLQVLLVGTKAAEVALKPSLFFDVSSSLQDFIALNDRQYAAQMVRYDTEMATFRDDYRRQLSTISFNSDFIDTRIAETIQRLRPLEVLNDQTKSCVQQYSSLLVTSATVRSTYSSCSTSAASSLVTILSVPDVTYRTLMQYYNVNWKTGLQDCANKFKDSYRNQTICVNQFVGTSNAYFANNQRLFRIQMDAARCATDSRLKEAVQCVFYTTDSALSSIGVTNRLIDDCIAGVGQCTPCPENTPQCPNSINIPTDSNTYVNATIKNPFLGMNTSTDCVLVKLTKPAKSV